MAGPRQYSGDPFSPWLLTLTSPTCGGMGDAQRVGPFGNQGNKKVQLLPTGLWTFCVRSPAPRRSQDLYQGAFAQIYLWRDGFVLM